MTSTIDGNAATSALTSDDLAVVTQVCASCDNDPGRMMDILIALQDRFRQISPPVMEAVAQATGQTRIAVEGVASFYMFLSLTPKGRVTIRLCDDIIDRLAGLEDVIRAFQDGLSIKVGETTEDGAYSLDCTPCIGLCDQAPAAMINDVVVTRLTADKVRGIIDALRSGARPEDLVSNRFDDMTPHERATRMVDNNIRHAGSVLLGPVPKDAGLNAAIGMKPKQILSHVISSGVRGCGGAGYPTGRKWRAAADAVSDRRFVICNADEGEPGTFKDRVLLTERADLMIEGMTIAARAVGAREGLIYLRGEYAYLKDLVLQTLARRRADGLLGRAIMGVEGFDFDIRLQMGAGAYICGEEGALISSCEGLPGEPRTRPPFPVTRGYLGHPTVVNNVETFCHVARILDIGPEAFFNIGIDGSHGTKIYSISGDCLNPGLYELPHGETLQTLLDMAGAGAAAAVLVGGPSGELIARDTFHRRLAFSDLAGGGAVVVFDGTRNILEIVEYYMSFFVHESCGYCTPCRVGNVFLQKAVAKFRNGLANVEDIAYLQELSATIIETSRCGLGMSSPKPILSSLKNFPLVYSAMVKPTKDRIRATFDVQSAIDGARKLAMRRSHIFDRDFSE